MADIELVIKIPEKMYKWVNDVNKFFDDYGTSDFIDLVKNGVVLPKGHGNLKDMGNLKYVFDLTRDDLIYSGKDIEQAVNSMKSIIEADKCTYEETGCGSCKRQLDCPI